MNLEQHRTSISGCLEEDTLVKSVVEVILSILPIQIP